MKCVFHIVGFALLMFAISDSRSAPSFGVSITISDPKSFSSGRILGESDNGKTLLLHVGDSFKVDLPTHFGADPAWRVVTQDLLATPKVSIAAAATRANVIAPQRFEFCATDVGSSVLRLEYRGNPHGEVKTFRATVRIEKP